MESSIAIINGSRGGSEGNSQVVIDCLLQLLRPKIQTEILTLKSVRNPEEWKPFLERANGFLFVTGTYWDSWGSPLQYFFEELTSTEGSSLWFGKPCAAVVTMHSVGGKGVLSRLMGVLNTFGLYFPPMSGMTYSAVNQAAHKANNPQLEMWLPEDMKIVCHNLFEAVSGSRNWKSWPVDESDFAKVWIERALLQDGHRE